MPPLRVMIDTNVVDALSSDPDTLLMVIKLQASGMVQLLITPPPSRSAVEGSSPHSENGKDPGIHDHQHGRLGVGRIMGSIRLGRCKTGKRLGHVRGVKRRRSKQWADTLISVTAASRTDVYVTNDKQARNAAKRIMLEDGLKLRVWSRNYQSWLSS
jgi:hypothetical protein